MFYKHKPTVVEAIKWVGANQPEVEEFVGKGNFLLTKEGDFLLSTSHGTIYVNVNDFIIRGIDGEFYPCDPTTFKNNYVSV